jgi:hypothetical protein
MCLISGRASDPFHGHTAANLSMKPSRRQIPGNDSQSKSKSFALEDIYRSIRASYYTPNESYHCPHTCSMWISAAFTYTPAYRPPHVASYGQKNKATSGQQDLPSRDNHYCRPALHIIMRVACRGCIDYATDLSSPCILHAFIDRRIFKTS